VNILDPSLLTFLQNLTNQEAPLLLQEILSVQIFPQQVVFLRLLQVGLQESLLQVFLQEDFLLQVFLQEDLLLPQRMSFAIRPYRLIVV
jgi:hypothetical protein